MRVILQRNPVALHAHGIAPPITMITFSSAELNTLIAGLLWPLSRILGLIAAAPIFGNVSVPVQVKIGLGILFSIIIAPLVPALPALDPISLQGLLILTQQFILGLAMGFAMRIVFAAMEMAGSLVGMTMGLSFATFFDPQSHGQSTAIGQVFALLATLAFLAVNGHLVLISALAESFITLPIASTPLDTQSFYHLAQWGGKIFSIGLQLAMPILAALLITNIALGILTRAAPQLNIFGIGFPVTLSVGFILIALALPYLAVPLERLFQEAFETVQQISTPAPVLAR